MSDKRTAAQRWADAVTEFSGSWGFIWSFMLLLALWMGSRGMENDPYPFLLLNLALTVISTLQSPLIMMSQNRQNENDREKTEQDRAQWARIEAMLERLANEGDRK